MSELPAIAIALREVMKAKGITVPDLARDLHWPEATLYNIYAGKVTKIRSRQLRDGLDAYFGVPEGTTFRICEDGGSYLNGNGSPR
jgi:transcriptional regulator with XRE-family HTH domain